MGKIIFFIGATRSGKSRLAAEAARNISSRKVAFVATCIAQDSEMKGRIMLHKKNRPDCWKTFEVRADLLKELKKLRANFEVVVIDCLTLFVSGLLMIGEGEEGIKKRLSVALGFASKAAYTTIIVSNEVGAGLVPENRLARKFRDLAGMANQMVAEKATEVYLAVAGIAVKIK